MAMIIVNNEVDKEKMWLRNKRKQKKEEEKQEEDTGPKKGQEHRTREGHCAWPSFLQTGCRCAYR